MCFHLSDFHTLVPAAAMGGSHPGTYKALNTQSAFWSGGETILSDLTTVPHSWGSCSPQPTCSLLATVMAIASASITWPPAGLHQQSAPSLC